MTATTDTDPRELRNPYLSALATAQGLAMCTGAISVTHNDGRGNIATYVLRPEELERADRV